MTYDIILFTGMEGPHFPAKTAGTFKIGSFLRQQGYSVKIIDCIVHLLDNRYDQLCAYVDECIGKNTLFVGFGTSFLTDRNIDLLSKFMERIYLKHPDVKIVLGGFGRSTVKLVTRFDYVDHWSKGLSENNVLTILNDKDAPRVVYDSTHAASYNFRESVPMFSKEDTIFEGEVLPIEISRGCRFKCKFCTFDLIGRKPSNEYIRSEDSIYNELKFNYENWGTTQYQIMCDTFNETSDKLLTVKRAMDRVGVDFNFWAFIRADLLHAHPEQISILRDMGARNVFFGIESFYDPAAKAIGKGLGREKLVRTIEKVNKSWGKDSLLHGSFIIGLPHETEDTANEWCQMILDGESHLDHASWGPLHIRVGEEKGISWRFYSEFDRNAEKYGYKKGPLKQLVNGGKKTVDWDNGNFTYESASILARHWHNQFDEKYPRRNEGGDSGGGRYISILNCGYSWQEIVDNKTEDILERGWQLYEKYADEVFLN